MIGSKVVLAVNGSWILGLFAYSLTACAPGSLAPEAKRYDIVAASLLLVDGVRVRLFNGSSAFNAPFPLPTAIGGVRVQVEPEVPSAEQTSFAETIELVDAAGEAVPVVFKNWTDDGSEVTLQPQQRLEFRQSYRLRSHATKTIDTRVELGSSPEWFTIRARRDINGDGYGDFAVGSAAPSASNVTEGGRFYVFNGSNEGFGDCDFRTGCTSFDAEIVGKRPEFAKWLANAGDVNADGFADVVVASPATEFGAGSAWVFVGGPDGLGFCDLFTPCASLNGTLSSVTGGKEPGTRPAVAAAGDFDGDGFDDVIISNAERDPGHIGQVRVVFGSTLGIASCNFSKPDDTCPRFVTISQPADMETFGWFVAGGDFNGDGFADVAIGTPRPGGVAPGEVIVINGSDSPTDCDLAMGCAPATTLIGPTNPSGAAELFGAALDAAGDVNGDGFTDLIVGAQSDYGFGHAYIFNGSKSGVRSCSLAEGCVPATTFTGSPTPFGSMFLGVTVGGVGDLNADGFDDVIIGYSGSGPRGFAIFLGERHGIPDCDYMKLCEPSWTLDGTSGYRTTVALGDANADGFDDFGVTDPVPYAPASWAFSGIGPLFSTCDPRKTPGCPKVISYLQGLDDWYFGSFR